VVSDTMTAMRPLSWMSIERTMPSSTIELRSSGSMTASSALRISSRDGMSDILANVRSFAVVLVLALTGCGSEHHRAKPVDWRKGADAACFKARSLLAPLAPPSDFRTAELVAGAVALALRQELDGTAALGPPPAADARAAERLRRARRAMLVELLAEIRAARAHDLRGIQRSIRRLTPLTHAATAAATAAGLRICGHELDRGLAEAPA